MHRKVYPQAKFQEMSWENVRFPIQLCCSIEPFEDVAVLRKQYILHYLRMHSSVHDYSEQCVKECLNTYIVQCSLDQS